MSDDLETVYYSTKTLLVMNLFLIDSRAGSWGSFTFRVKRKRAEASIIFWKKRLDLLLQMFLSFFTDVILSQGGFFFTTGSFGREEENKDNTTWSHACYTDLGVRLYLSDWQDYLAWRRMFLFAFYCTLDCTPSLPEKYWPSCRLCGSSHNF